MLSDKAKENKIKYTVNYNKSHYKRIPLDVTPEKFEQIKEFANNCGVGVNTFIKSAIDEKIEREWNGNGQK